MAQLVTPSDCTASNESRLRFFCGFRAHAGLSVPERNVHVSPQSVFGRLQDIAQRLSSSTHSQYVAYRHISTE